MRIIANVLTGSRVLMGIVMVIVAILVSSVQAVCQVVLVLFIACLITDWLDGYFARRAEGHVIEHIDAAADSVSILGAATALILVGRLSWLVPVALYAVGGLAVARRTKLRPWGANIVAWAVPVGSIILILVVVWRLAILAGIPPWVIGAIGLPAMVILGYLKRGRWLSWFTPIVHS